MDTQALKLPKPTYKAAGLVSKTIAAHFTQHLSNAALTGEKDLAPEPTPEIVEAIIDAGFWTSLRKEEGHSPRISLAFLNPEAVSDPIIFEKPLELKPKVLSKIAPGVERAGIHLGVWYNDKGLYVWGTTRKLPAFCFVLEMVEPGLLVVKHKRFHGFGKFVNVAILKGDEIKIVDEQSGAMPDCPQLLSTLVGFNSGDANSSVNVLIQLATSMRAHNRGGTLLVVPSTQKKWRESITHPISYPVMPTLSKLADLIRQKDKTKAQVAWHAELGREVDSVAGLTAIDGATIINDEYELIAFGAKIRRADNSTSVEEMIMTEPIIGGEALVLHPTQIGGTRHLSAAQFVFDQRDAIALVASQDGRFTIFGWSPCDDMVHAHRIDSLLL
jgi:DNA integrity scanning protein DisA with diadenylate cyclase activity